MANEIKLIIDGEEVYIKNDMSDKLYDGIYCVDMERAGNNVIHDILEAKYDIDTHDKLVNAVANRVDMYLNDIYANIYDYALEYYYNNEDELIDEYYNK